MTPEQLLLPMMNGTDEEVIKALSKTMKLDFSGNQKAWSMCVQPFIMELWCRGITKEQFLAWEKTNANDSTK